MEQVLVYGIGVLAVAAVLYMLLKKYDIKITWLAVGLLLMYVAVLMGKSIPGETGYAIIDPIMAIVEQFKATFSQAGLVILLLGGYSAYMSAIGANDVTVYALTKPLKRVKSTYVLIPIVFLLGNLLSLVIPSASNLAIILLATLYPVLKKANMSTLTAAGIIATTATIMPSPLGADNVAVAQQLNMSVTEYVIQYHAIISIPTLIIIAFIHMFWQKYCDKRDQLKKHEADHTEIELEEIKPIEGSGLYKFVYGLLPLLPIVLLIIVFISNTVFHSKLTIGVEVVTLISFLVAILVELISKRRGKEVLQNTENFFKGMGNAMGIVALLVAASIFVAGLTSIGIMQQLEKTMTSLSGAGYILPIIMVLFTAIIVLISGSGTALFYAMIPLMVPLAAAAGISAVMLSIPMGMAGNLLRAVSPVAAVIVIIAGTTKENPINIVKRTSVPMIGGTVIMLILSFLFLH